MSALTRAMTEDELLTAITEAATYRGWRWFHIRRSDKALQMGHSGFPDLVLAREGRVVFLELKREGIAPRADQEAWRVAVNGSRIPHPGSAVQAHVIWPSELDELLKWLQ